MRATKVSIVLPALALIVAACSAAATPVPTKAPTAAPTAAATTAATAAPTAAPTTPPLAKIRFRFDWIKTPGDTAMQVAISNGYFREANLEVTTTIGTGSTDSVTLTGAGQFEMAQAASLNLAVGVANGVPVKAVGVLYQKDPNGMISRQDAPIRVPTDLYGKKDCIQQGSSLQYYKAVVAANKLDTSKITEVPVGFDVAPLVQKQCDGLIDFADGEVLLVKQAMNADPVFVPVKDWGVTTYGTTLLVSNAFASSNADAVKRFVNAFARGLKYAVENPAAAATIMRSAYSDVDGALLQAKVLAAYKFWTSPDTDTNGVLFNSTDVWQKELDLARQIGLISKTLAPADVMTNDFLPKPGVMAKPAS